MSSIMCKLSRLTRFQKSVEYPQVQYVDRCANYQTSNISKFRTCKVVQGIRTLGVLVDCALLHYFVSLLIKFKVEFALGIQNHVLDFVGSARKHKGSPCSQEGFTQHHCARILKRCIEESFWMQRLFLVAGTGSCAGEKTFFMIGKCKLNHYKGTHTTYQYLTSLNIYYWLPLFACIGFWPGHAIGLAGNQAPGEERLCWLRAGGSVHWPPRQSASVQWLLGRGTFDG